jgi:hypothetical protein
MLHGLGLVHLKPMLDIEWSFVCDDSKIPRERCLDGISALLLEPGFFRRVRKLSPRRPQDAGVRSSLHQALSEKKGPLWTSRCHLKAITLSSAGIRPRVRFDRLHKLLRPINIATKRQPTSPVRAEV